MSDKKMTTIYYKQKKITCDGKSLCFLTLGLTLVIIGLILLVTFPSILNYFVSKNMSMQSDTDLYRNWLEPNVSLFFDIYMFNWTNPEDINNPNIKPKFEEVGPYRYKAHYKKVNIVWNEENGTVTYENRRTYYYDENSPRNHSDVVNSINVVALSAAYYGKDFNFVLKQMVKLALMDSPIYVKKQVRELLFDGYADTMVTMASIFPLSSLKVVPDKFGWFYTLNGTAGIDGVYNMETKPGEKFGAIHNFNYVNKSTMFDGYCSNINVSPGELYPRNVKPTTLSYLNPDMCRPMQLEFERQINIKKVFAYKFSSTINTFDNGTLFEKNKCFCTEKCQPVGVTPTCSLDYPLYYSLPHFYAADASYLDKLDGLNPQKDLHEFTMTVEPDTGAVINTSATLQFNLLLEPSDDFSLFYKVPKMLFPIFWLRQYPILSDKVYDDLALLSDIPRVVEIIAIALIIIGAMSIVITLLRHFVNYNSKVRRKEMLCKEEVPLRLK